ncbi:hypothetical protein C2R22_18790 [Salinigranum rubrum]|uniref:AB hydrolase-1 domain-containing protein n=1 Tax=Salinigranum rubrum TaxID=755307 RepID=A0A2I8VND0_9EURY|nr:hypothetical protein [Salinigranum rubrum]AUV83437.1 hypothetical protein C2R22_18790 [Salinigranum rubrum]
MSQTTGPPDGQHRTSSFDPLDHDDPRVEAARRAERRAYEAYGLGVTEQFVDVSALDLHVRVVEVGTGPPVVVVPGGVGYGAVWIPFLPELDGYRLLVVDRPGGGSATASTTVPRRWRPSQRTRRRPCSTTSVSTKHPSLEARWAASGGSDSLSLSQNECPRSLCLAVPRSTRLRARRFRCDSSRFPCSGHSSPRR